MTEARPPSASTVRIAATGAGGMLGRELLRAARAREIALLGWDRRALDVTDADAARRALDEARPDVVIHAAAWTDVDGCEADPERAFRTNAKGTVNLAAACREAGARLVTISTDYVFDGEGTEPYREDAPPGPMNVYGWSKLAAEDATLALGRSGCVARTAWLYADHGKNFFRTMLRLAEERSAIDVVDDQHGCPTFAADLAEALLEVAASGASGVLHVVNGGATTWYGFARAIFAEASRPVVVRAVTSERFPRPARRPHNSVLSDSRLAAAGMASPPAWEDGLRRCVVRVADQTARPAGRRRSGEC
jgi:dTDP-4-dehydrorhamnose reductase